MSSPFALVFAILLLFGLQTFVLTDAQDLNRKQNPMATILPPSPLLDAFGSFGIPLKRDIFGIRQASCTVGNSLCPSEDQPTITLDLTLISNAPDIPGDVCCPTDNSCCGVGVCIPPGDVCCSYGGGCLAGHDCCGNGCMLATSKCCTTHQCFDGYDCCSTGCVPTGTVCCLNGTSIGYCQAESICCGGGFCAPPGGICCPGGGSCANGQVCTTVNGQHACSDPTSTSSFGNGQSIALTLAATTTSSENTAASTTSGGTVAATKASGGGKTLMLEHGISIMLLFIYSIGFALA
jgi:hypothetical protein